MGLIGVEGSVRGARDGGPGGCGGGAGGGPGAVGLGAEDGAIVESETAGGGCHHSVAGSVGWNCDGGDHGSSICSIVEMSVRSGISMRVPSSSEP